jgi:hypothetical protein
MASQYDLQLALRERSFPDLGGMQKLLLTVVPDQQRAWPAFEHLHLLGI